MASSHPPLFLLFVLLSFPSISSSSRPTTTASHTGPSITYPSPSLAPIPILYPTLPYSFLALYCIIPLIPFSFHLRCITDLPLSCPRSCPPFPPALYFLLVPTNHFSLLPPNHLLLVPPNHFLLPTSSSSFPQTTSFCPLLPPGTANYFLLPSASSLYLQTRFTSAQQLPPKYKHNERPCLRTRKPTLSQNNCKRT